MFDKLRKKKEMLEAYRKVFLSPEGKIVLKDLMKSTYFYNTTQDADPTIMAFQEGQRALVLRLLNTLKMSHEHIERMIEEQIFEEDL